MRVLGDFTVDVNGTLLDAAQVIDRNHNRIVLAVDSRKVIGVLSEGDLMRALLHGATIRAPLTKFIRHDFVFLNERDDAQALEIFRTRGITLIPVLSKDFVLADVILLSDILAKCRLA